MAYNWRIPPRIHCKLENMGTNEVTTGCGDFAIKRKFLQIVETTVPNRIYNTSGSSEVKERIPIYNSRPFSTTMPTSPHPHNMCGRQIPPFLWFGQKVDTSIAGQAFTTRAFTARAGR